MHGDAHLRPPAGLDTGPFYHAVAIAHPAPHAKEKDYFFSAQAPLTLPLRPVQDAP